MNVKPTLALVGLSIAAQAAYAGDNSPLSLGLGATVSSGFYLDYDDDPLPIPLITYQSGDLYVRATELGYIVFDRGYKVSVIGNIGTAEFDPDDSNRLAALDERDRALESGVRFSMGNFNIAALTDISATHDGQRVDANYAFALATGNSRWNVVPAAGVEWQSDDYSNYYYGVSGAESARTGGAVATYDASDSWNAYIKADTTYQIDKHWSLVGSAKYTWLDDEISDSAMVDEDSYGQLTFGVKYAF